MNAVLQTIPYIGAKTKVAPAIVSLVPSDFREYREPFLGGGSVAIHLMRHYPDRKFWINELYPPLYSIWKNLIECPVEMIGWILRTRDEFKTLKELYDHCNGNVERVGEFERGCMQLVLIKLSRGYAAQRAGFSRVRGISESSLYDLLPVSEVLQRVDVKLTNFSYPECIGGGGRNVIIFADPPYDIRRPDLYGRQGDLHKAFSHSYFAVKMRACRHKWLLTYNDNENIRNLYSDFDITPYQMTYGVKPGADSGNELLIRNFDCDESSAVSPGFNESPEVGQGG